MTGTFMTKVVADGVWHSQDNRGGVVYLVAGCERALLIDTGWGEGDLQAHVATLTSLPLWVANTHGHRDHTSGNGQFDEVFIHTADLPLVDTSMTKFIPIYDGYTFDLGERELRVIGVAGHSPGSICLLDKTARILFSGDSPRPGAIWLHLETSLTVQQFRRSMARLATFADAFDIIAPSHGEPVPAGTWLDDLIACADGILSGELEGKPHETRFGEALLAEAGDAGIIYHADRIRWDWASGFRERMISPEVHADRRVTFRVKAPNAKRVVFQSGPILNALGSADGEVGFHEVDEDGVWSLTLGPLPPDIYDYVYIIDGVAFIDSNNPSVQTGTASPRSLVAVPAEDKTAYWDARDVPHGALHRHFYHSEAVGSMRDAYIYTPPGYDEDAERTYPVLYLLHGGGDDAQGWSLVGQAHMIMDNLIAESKAQPMIIVMPNGQPVPRSSSWEMLRTQNTPLLEKDLLGDLMPLVESTYRIQANREHRAMAGLSMGGGQTNDIGLNHLDLFSHIGILSAGRFDFAEDHPDLAADPTATNEKLALLFLGCGTFDPLAIEGMERLHAQLTQIGIEHIYWTLEGAAHTWVVWRTALYDEFLPRLWRA
ncbi:MAG: MBL fold metallo-hydrolase [Anaerolineae bacterium]|nr:MBL fold metallo-hydrolase [Anaerolineae bacterium]